VKPLNGSFDYPIWYGIRQPKPTRKAETLAWNGQNALLFEVSHEAHIIRAWCFAEEIECPVRLAEFNSGGT
jgi:hypothetical protein